MRSSGGNIRISGWVTCNHGLFIMEGLIFYILIPLEFFLPHNGSIKKKHQEFYTDIL